MGANLFPALEQTPRTLKLASGDVLREVRVTGGGPRVGAVGESVTADGDILHHPKWPGGLYCTLIWFRRGPWGAYSEDTGLMSGVDSFFQHSEDGVHPTY